MTKYRLTISKPGGAADSVMDLEEGWSIPFDPDNSHYQKYLDWVAEGNTALPVLEPTDGGSI